MFDRRDSDKKYYLNNKEKKSEYYKKYYKENIEVYTKRNKKYSQNHKVEIKKYTDNYYSKQINSDRRTEKAKKWDEENPEKRLIIMKRHFKKYGSVYDMNSKSYESVLYVWSKNIKKLDNHMCKNCDSTEKLRSHHIMPKLLFPKISLDLDNGVTLCHNCHMNLHHNT